MSSKKCSNCFKILPLSDFYPKRVNGKTKHQSRCKKCNNEVCAGYRARARRRKVQNILSFQETN